MKAKVLILCEHFNIAKMESIAEWHEFDYDFPKIAKPRNFEKRVVECEIENRQLIKEFYRDFDFDFDVKNDIWNKIDHLIPKSNGKRIAWIYFDELQTAIECSNDYSSFSFKDMISSISIEKLKDLHEK